ncbi:MAG: DUF5667 domain-containing protein [Anaerolineales bacterium]|nr:DUF5667 domain-containing protein [Anaerolineales bacterium]MDW8227572.1 DUF5667 domain-containing protein [Anaerolineales bacterium]
MNDEIDPQLKQRLKRLKNVPARDSHAAAHGRARFLAEAAALQDASPRRSLLSRRLAWNFAALVLTLLLLFGGSVGAAFAAQAALPDQALYPLKLAVEDFRLGLTADPQTKIDLLMEFAGVRVLEINQLAAQGKVPPAETTGRLEEHIHFALQLAAGMDDPAMLTALQYIRSQLEVQAQTISEGQGEPGAVLQQARLMLQAQIRQIDEGLTSPEQFRVQTRQDRPMATLSPMPSRLFVTPTPQSGGGAGQGGTPTPDETGGQPPQETPGTRTPQKTPRPTGGQGPQGTPGGGGGGGHP